MLSSKNRSLLSEKKSIAVYDTTLRDGAQATGVAFSLEDKLKITKRLDSFVDFIEGGWPSSNPKDLEYFKAARKLKLSSRISAFGSTMRVGLDPEDDINLLNLLQAADVIAIFGKSWGLHIRKVLRTTPSENLRLIKESVNFIKKNGATAIYDAEHFFDGYVDDREYALKTLDAAGSADVVVLCDTNGGRTPSEIYRIVQDVRNRVNKPLGIHAHNDAGCAVANTLMAVEAGVEHVQATVNGLGERAGNADLTSVLPALKFKMGLTLTDLRGLTRLSSFVYEIANIQNDPFQPYVGKYVFSHKGGIHVDAMLKSSQSYEHLNPGLVGNSRIVSVSEQSGKASVVAKAAEFGFKLHKSNPKVEEILQSVKGYEKDGYKFENAEASLYLLMLRNLGPKKNLFDVTSWTAIVYSDGTKVVADSTVTIKVGKKIIHTASQGNGPVHSLDLALRKALKEVYPQAEKMKLAGFRVKEIDSDKGTAAKVRVLIDFSNSHRSWSTVGVSENILEASKIALIDGYKYFLVIKQED